MQTGFWQKINIELMVWPLGLILLYYINPNAKGNSLCLLKRAGLSFCPGCGLGHGIHYFLHGQWEMAFHHHWLSPLVVVVLGYRIVQLAILQYADFKHS
ncbi:DUF2752 domain-containing protein [Chitinophaga sp. 30R24]|uniref:DUF2752 domain-containing protein n=1 Tax=Chitinophaga sp. 30R24 TaxID=3248838 RepID=UPI003B8FE79D